MTTRQIFRRKKEGKTDYRSRLALLKSGKDRLVIRITGKNVIGQVVRYGETGDQVIFTVTDKTLGKKGLQIKGNSSVVCYLVGLEIARLAKEKGIEEMVLDTGRRRIVKGGRIAAALKGVTDGAILVPHDPAIFPDQKRILGGHLKNGGLTEVKLKDYIKKIGVKN